MVQRNNEEIYIKRCIILAENALKQSENPFGCVIVQNGKIVAESGNKTKVEKDVSRHAEITALKTAQEKFGDDLSTCELYSNCEPCVMCSFVIRELRIKKVVFSLRSPKVGGYSRWDILQDKELSKLNHPYSQPPEIIPDILSEEAKKTFQQIGWYQLFEKI